jgi:hypothetical protein
MYEPTQGGIYADTLGILQGELKMAAVWKKFDGSEEHKEMMRKAFNGWECRLHDGRQYRNLPAAVNPPYDEIDEFLIYDPHPHKDMIIEWANTGKPVYFINRPGRWVKSTAPQWNLLRTYSFDPPINQGYRKYKYRDEAGLIHVQAINRIGSVLKAEQIESFSQFIGWIDDDWQEVEV